MNDEVWEKENIWGENDAHGAGGERSGVGGKVLWVVNESPLLELCQRHTDWEGDKWLISGYTYRTNLLLLPRRVVTNATFVYMHRVKLNVKKGRGVGGIRTILRARYVFHEAITRPSGKCASVCIYMFSKSAYSLSNIYTYMFSWDPCAHCKSCLLFILFSGFHLPFSVVGGQPFKLLEKNPSHFYLLLEHLPAPYLSYTDIFCSSNVCVGVTIKCFLGSSHLCIQ